MWHIIWVFPTLSLNLNLVGKYLLLCKLWVSGLEFDVDWSFKLPWGGLCGALLVWKVEKCYYQNRPHEINKPIMIISLQNVSLSLSSASHSPQSMWHQNHPVWYKWNLFVLITTKNIFLCFMASRGPTNYYFHYHFSLQIIFTIKSLKCK